MKLRDIVIAVVILGVVGFILYNISTTDNTPTIESTPNPTASESDFEERFRRDIPDDVEKAELRSPDEGEGQGQVSAIATRDFKNNTYSATILADLEEPDSGKSYYGWINKDQQYVLLGKLQSAKGGWLIDYESSTNYSDYNRIVISEQSNTTSQPEGIVLEGSF